MVCHLDTCDPSEECWRGKDVIQLSIFNIKASTKPGDELVAGADGTASVIEVVWVDKPAGHDQAIVKRPWPAQLRWSGSVVEVPQENRVFLLVNQLQHLDNLVKLLLTIGGEQWRVGDGGANYIIRSTQKWTNLGANIFHEKVTVHIGMELYKKNRNKEEMKQHGWWRRATIRVTLYIY